VKAFTVCALLNCLLVATAFGGDTTGKKPAATTSPAAKLSSSAAGGASALLSDSEIADFKTEVADPDGKKRVQFMADLSVPRLKDAERKKFERSGKVPVRITCSLEEIKAADPKPLVKRLSGRAQFYLLDSDSKVVFRKSMPLEKMCPS
jgi:hypothetical protein